MLEVSFTPALEDMVAHHTFALNRSPELRRRLRVSWVAIPVGLWVVALVLWLAGTYPPLAIGIAVAGVVVALFFPVIRRSWIGQWAQQHARFNAEGGFGRLTLTLTDDEFRLRGEVTDTTARWEKMKGVVVGADYTAILITEQITVVIPRRALENDASYAAVRDFALAKLRPFS